MKGLIALVLLCATVMPAVASTGNAFDFQYLGDNSKGGGKGGGGVGPAPVIGTGLPVALGLGAGALVFVGMRRRKK